MIGDDKHVDIHSARRLRGLGESDAGDASDLAWRRAQIDWVEEIEAHQERFGEIWPYAPPQTWVW